MSGGDMITTDRYAVSGDSAHVYVSDETGHIVATCETLPDAQLIAGTLNTGWPDRMEMVRQLREAVGLFTGAMPISPRQAWEEALNKVRELRGSK